MEKQSNKIEKKVNKGNSNYVEIFKFLKNGGRKIEKDIRKTREIKFCYEVQMIREELSRVLDSTKPVNPEIRHIRIIVAAIQNAIFLLDGTRKNFHSKRLFKVRENANDLLKEVKKQCQKIHMGGSPIRK